VRLVGAEDLEIPIDENVVRSVDADVVDLILAVAQLHHVVDDATVRGPRGARQVTTARMSYRPTGRLVIGGGGVEFPTFEVKPC
jgi:hypothetical protein